MLSCLRGGLAPLRSPGMVDFPSGAPLEEGVRYAALYVLCVPRAVAFSPVRLLVLGLLT
jgi:hypothetical protein